MKCKHFGQFFVIFLTLVIMFPLCCGVFCVDASASETYTKMSFTDFRSIIGDHFSCNYKRAGSSYSTTFDYIGAYSANNPWRSISVEQNNVATTTSGLFQYDVLCYKANLPYNTSDTLIEDIVIDFYCRFSGGARGGIILFECSSNSIDQKNLIDGESYCGSFSAPCGDYSTYSGLTDYYGIVGSSASDTGYSISGRPIFYDSTNFELEEIHYNNMVTVQSLYLYFLCPYIYGDVYNAPAVTTVSGSGGQTIINNNVDLTETHGFLSGIWEAITGIPSAILQGIQRIFVPSSEFMADLDSEIEDIRDRFAWVDEIQSLGADLADILENRESVIAPVVVIPSIVNSKDNTIYTEEAETVLDLSEYDTEIMVVRSVLAVMLWLFFVWRLFARLPDIIHGGGMVLGDGSRIMNELDTRETQAIFNDIESHANAIYQGSFPDISHIDDAPNVDWKV